MKKGVIEGEMEFYDQSTLWRTRFCVPDRGFLTTIQNITDVAKLNAYLGVRQNRRASG